MMHVITPKACNLRTYEHLRYALGFRWNSHDTFNKFGRTMTHQYQAAGLCLCQSRIVGHIAPGIGGETFAYTELWHPNYVAEYLQLLGCYEKQLEVVSLKVWNQRIHV